MKVLYVVSATQVTGGGSKSFLNLLHGVIHHGIEPLVVCPDQGKMFQNLQKKRIKVANCFYRFNTYPPVYPTLIRTDNGKYYWYIPIMSNL